jgi:hypothetical protein
VLDGGRRTPLLALVATTVLASCGAEREAPPGTPANVALGRPVSVVGGASGAPPVVTDGRLAVEGIAPGDAALTLAGVRSAVVVDLGAPRRVSALLLQASGSEVYFTEASNDATSWRTVWRVEPVPGPPVARTRTTVLRRPVEARWLRVRPTTAGSAMVSELQAFEAEPRSWPPLDTSHPDATLPLWPSLTRERLAAVYQALASLLMLAVGWGLVSRKRPAEGDERVRRRVFAGLALACLLAWPNLLNFHYYGFVHKWEVFHYYVGGKYLPELGYTRLYACTAAVDAEDGLDLGAAVMRDLRDNRLVPASTLLERSEECRARFSPERWRAFGHDTRFFREALGEPGWLGVRRDHGYNGTPAWAVVAGLLARSGPASWTQIGLLTALDVLLILATLLVIGRVFGLEAACLAAGFWGVNTLSVWGWTGGGFLRYDWVLWLVVGVAALRGGRPGTAGFALGYAALLRVFPAFAIGAVALKAAVEAASQRSLAPLRGQLRFAAGVTAAGVLFLASSSLMAGRAQIWGEFADNSRKHLVSESVNTVGLPVLLAYHPDTRLELMTDPLALDRHEGWKERLAAATRETRPAHWAGALAFVVLLALAVRGVPDWIAAVLGVGLMPILVKLSSYYYCGFVVFAALWPVSPGVGFALVVFAWLTNVIVGLWPAIDARYAWLSLAAVVFATAVTGAIAWRSRGPRADRRP